jgi:hypothetical protein
MDYLIWPQANVEGLKFFFFVVAFRHSNFDESVGVVSVALRTKQDQFSATRVVSFAWRDLLRRLLKVLLRLYLHEKSLQGSLDEKPTRHGVQLPERIGLQQNVRRTRSESALSVNRFHSR